MTAALQSLALRLWCAMPFRCLRRRLRGCAK